MKKFGLLGYPLGHSYSPLIHNRLFELVGLDCEYSLIECNENELKEKIDSLRNGYYSGFNVTIPYKKKIMEYLDEISTEAFKIGAVNTVANIDGKIIGFNTDYYGFKDEIIYYNIDVKNKDCYILGTGGASLAVNKALIDLGGNTYYVSRNKNGDNIISYEELANRDIYLLVNTTPVGMYPNINNSPVSFDIAKRAKYVVDVIFNPNITKLLCDAKSEMNGLFMLVKQALKAEEIWQNNTYSELTLEILEYVRKNI